MNYYQHHIGDFNNATRHLTRVERSLYRDAIELYYDKEKPLDPDFNRLSKRLMANSEDEKDALNEVLSEFFTLEDDGYHHPRCDEEIRKYQANSTAKSRAGKASAAKRQQNKTLVQQEFDTCSTNHKPITNNQEPIQKKKKATKKFVKPSVDEINTYCRERKNSINAQQFFDHYESNGWKVGKNPMKNWQAAVRTWEQRENQGSNNGQNQSNNQSRSGRVNSKLDKIAQDAIDRGETL